MAPVAEVGEWTIAVVNQKPAASLNSLNFRFNLHVFDTNLVVQAVQLVRNF